MSDIVIFEAKTRTERDFVIDRVCQAAGVFARVDPEDVRCLRIVCKKAERKRAIAAIPSRKERLAVVSRAKPIDLPRSPKHWTFQVPDPVGRATPDYPFC